MTRQPNELFATREHGDGLTSYELNSVASAWHCRCHEPWLALDETDEAMLKVHRGCDPVACALRQQQWEAWSREFVRPEDHMAACGVVDDDGPFYLVPESAESQNVRAMIELFRWEEFGHQHENSPPRRIEI